jgi:YidC/Oxa1 family membrane protein insertase
MRRNKIFLTAMACLTAGFVLFCGVLVFRSGLFQKSTGDNFILLAKESANEDATASLNSIDKKTEAAPQDSQPLYWAIGDDPNDKLFIGAKDPNTEDPDKGFRLQLHLSNYGASIKKAVFSCGEGRGFNDRNPKGAKPLVLLAPVKLADGSEVFSMANQTFELVEQKTQLALEKLSWKPIGVKINADGSQSAIFDAEINYAGTEPVIRFRKTYTIYPKSYMVDCLLVVNNVSAKDQKISFSIGGPAGITREDRRAEDRKAIAGFINAKSQFTTVGKTIADLKKASTDKALQLNKDTDNFLWAAIVNKYFAAIVVPVADEGTAYCQWIKDKKGLVFNPGLNGSGSSETIGLTLKSVTDVVKAKDSRTYKFELYLGPKDKAVFDKDKHFRELGLSSAIDIPCCCLFCPLLAFIRPLAMGLITLMDIMYRFLPNYGVVIIILVCVVRLILHPLTRKSQVSMSKMGKLAPMVKEIQEKYKGDKVEMNKRVMAIYKGQGASPFLGMLPMLLQMPIWVALYSAIDASISLRGARFLPVWITDLSAPDALFHFPEVNLILFSFNSLNLLPILMGFAFYLQQKLTPQQTSAAAGPQMAQQQKMMSIMMTVLFPLMLYSAPSGLNLYIMASTFGGAIESYVIKKHIEQKEQEDGLTGGGMVAVTSKTGGKVKTKKPKPFFKKYM